MPSWMALYKAVMPSGDMLAEPAQVRLVSTDVSEYPTVKAFFRVEDPATGNALEGLGQRSFIIRERLEGGE